MKIFCACCLLTKLLVARKKFEGIIHLFGVATYGNDLLFTNKLPGAGAVVCAGGRFGFIGGGAA